MKAIFLFIALLAVMFAFSGCIGDASTVPGSGLSKVNAACIEHGHVISVNDPPNSRDVWVVCKDGTVVAVRVY